MSKLTRYVQVKLVLAGIGIVMLVWGLRVDDERIRWVGMGLLAISVLMRFLPRRLRDSDYPNDHGA